jgi:chromosome segregation ATPase
MMHFLHHYDAKFNMLHQLCITTMARITVDVPDADLSQIDAEAKQQKVSRSKWAATAIDAHLHQKCIISDADVMQLKDQVMQLQNQLDTKAQECDAQSQQITHHNDEISEKDDELDRLKQQIKESGSEATQRWEELKGYKSEATKLKKLLEESQATIQHLKDDLLNRQSETDLLAKTREEVAAAKMEANILREAMRVRDDDVAWLRSHVAQLTQQLALPPSEEEAKAKHWWKVWK